MEKRPGSPLYSRYLVLLTCNAWVVPSLYSENREEDNSPKIKVGPGKNKFPHGGAEKKR